MSHLQGIHIEDCDGKDRPDEEIIPSQEEAVGLLLELKRPLVDVKVVSISLDHLREHVHLGLRLLRSEKHCRLFKSHKHVNWAV